VRVTTTFNRLLGLDGASVVGVVFTDAGIVVTVRRRARLHRCPCGRRVVGRYDQSVRRWRHLDLGLGRLRVWLEADLARIRCPACRRVRTEQVPWARPGARHSRDFEDLVAWLATRMDKTSVATLMRCSWEAVHRIVTNVVAERLDDIGDSRLDGLCRIGVDEISYKRGHRYLTVVVDHDTRRVVWIEQGRSVEAMEKFYAQLGPARCLRLEAVTMDAAAAYIGATRAKAPNAIICFDPFHVIKWANQALDAAFRASAIPTVIAQMRASPGIRNRVPWRTARYALRAGRENISTEHRKLLAAIRSERTDLHQAYLLKEELRDLFQIIEPDQAEPYLKAWIRRAARSGMPQFTQLATKIAKHSTGIIAAVKLGLSNEWASHCTSW
jgi:transposase